VEKADALDALAVAMLLTRDGLLASLSSKPGEGVSDDEDRSDSNQAIEGIIKDLQWHIVDGESHTLASSKYERLNTSHTSSSHTPTIANIAKVVPA